MSLIVGLNQVCSGKLRVFDQDPAVAGRSIRKRLGVVTQENALDESLNVEENMYLYAAFMGVPKAERKARVDHLLSYMVLDHKRKDEIHTLSGGMKRRLVFVRALLGDPDLVILDEPTTGLDPAVRHLLWGKVKELKERGKTVLVTTHYIHEAEMLCDRVLILNQGSEIALGKPKELIHHHSPGFVGVFEKERMSHQLRDQAVRGGLQFFEDRSASYLRSLELEDLIEFQRTAHTAVLQIRPGNLEDVFLKLSGTGLNADA